MALSPEQKQKRAQKRAEYDAERERLYPSITLNYGDGAGNGCRIELTSDNPFGVTVSQRGEWDNDSSYAAGWSDFTFALTDLRQLAAFIHALVCRYNVLVDESNAIANLTTLKQLEKIDDGIAL